GRGRPPAPRPRLPAPGPAGGRAASPEVAPAPTRSGCSPSDHRGCGARLRLTAGGVHRIVRTSAARGVAPGGPGAAGGAGADGGGGAAGGEGAAGGAGGGVAGGGKAAATAGASPPAARSRRGARAGDADGGAARPAPAEP